MLGGLTPHRSSVCSLPANTPAGYAAARIAMHIAALIVGLVGTLNVSVAPPSAVQASSDEFAKHVAVVEDAARTDDAIPVSLSRTRGTDPEAEETRSVARLTLGRVDRKVGRTSGRNESDKRPASFALLHCPPRASATRDLRERLTLYCTWVV